MLNFFAIVLIIFIGILLLVLKKRIFKKLINQSNLNSIKLKKNKKSKNKFLSKNSYLYNHEEKKYSVFYKNSQRNKKFSLLQGSKENRLKH